MWRRLKSLVLVAAAVAGLLVLVGLPRPQAAPAPEKPPELEPEQPFPLVFFAVLEGLYTDGVSNEVVDLIIPPDPQTGRPKMDEHFIYACPLCHPAFDALVLYRSRQQFHGNKAGRDTLGPGLDERIVRKLQSDKKTERLDAIQGLIETWVRRRLDSMRLTREERAAWTAKMEEGRKQGMEMLKRLQADAQGNYAGWKGCAICEGSAAACKK